MNLFIYDNYKEYLRKRISEMPHRGKGIKKELAKTMGITASLITQVIEGERHFNSDQAFLLCKFFGLATLETQFFIELVNYARAKNPQLKKLIFQNLERARGAETTEANTEKAAPILTEEQRGLYYSNWFFSAIRIATFVKEFQTPDALADRLHLPHFTVQHVLDFLVSCGLCVRKDSRYIPTVSLTRVSAESPLLAAHLQNWRLRAIENLSRGGTQDFHFSSPVAIDAAEIPRVRALLTDFIRQFEVRVEAAHSEKLCCLNIDWFQF